MTGSENQTALKSVDILALYKLVYHRLNGSSSPVLTATSLSYKCTKHQFIHLLTATFKDLHIENSKN